jgi:putative multicomponent Na+:H+ antiporter subunit B
MNDTYFYVITALLPLSACLTVLQVNPYHALVIRGILGAVAALVYAMFGAADVALTEALVGTMLAITLYGVAVRSSMVMRLGMIENETKNKDDFKQLIDHLRNILNQYHLRLELVSYQDKKDLEQALHNQELHGTCELKLDSDRNITEEPYHTVTRVQRLYDIIKPEISSSVITYFNPSDTKEKQS